MIRSSARRRAAVPALPRPRHFIFLPYFHIQYTNTKPRRQRAPEEDPLHQLFASTRRSSAQPVCGHKWEWQYEQRDGTISERHRHSEYVPGRGWVDVEVDVQENQKGHEEFDIDLITMRRVRKTPVGSGRDGRDQTQTAGGAGRTGPVEAETPTPTPTPTPKPDQSQSKSAAANTDSTSRKASSNPAAVGRAARDPNGAVKHGAGIANILGSAEKAADTATPLMNDHRAAAESTSAIVPGTTEKVANTVIQDLPAESPPAIVPGTAKHLPDAVEHRPLESASAVVPAVAAGTVVQNLPAEPLESKLTIAPVAAEPCSSVVQVADTVVQDLPAESLAVEHRPPEASMEKAADTVVQDLPAQPLESQPTIVPVAAEPCSSVDQVADTVVQDLLTAPLAVEHQPEAPAEKADRPTAAQTVAAKPSPPTAAIQPDVEASVVVATAPAPSSAPAPEQDEDLDLLRPSDVRAAAGAPGKMSRRTEGDAEKARRRAQMLVEFEAAEAQKERESLEGVNARMKTVGEAAAGSSGNARSKIPGTETPQRLGGEPIRLPEAHKYFVLIYNPGSNDMQFSALPGGVSVRETTAFDSLQALRSPERFLPLWHVLQKGGFTVVGGEGDCLVVKVGAGVAMEKRELVMREIGGRVLPAASAEAGTPVAVAVPEQQQQQELVEEPQETVKVLQELVEEPQETVKVPQETVKVLQETVKVPQQDQEQQKQKQKTRPFRRVFWTAVWVAACSGVVSVGLEEYL